MSIINKDKAKEILSATGKKAMGAVSEVGTDTIKNLSSAVTDSGVKAIKKIGKTIGDTGSDAVKKAGETISEKTAKLTEELNKQKEQIKEQGFSETAIQTTQKMLAAVSRMPMIQVNREDFLRKQFGNSPYIEDIIAKGPQAVYSIDSLRTKAEEVIKSSTRKTAVASFAAGFASSPVAMAAAGAADIAQFFAFALNMAQKIAYIFGEDQIFHGLNPADDMLRTDGTALSEDAQVKLLSYLGVMMGVSGAGGLIVKTSSAVGTNIGKKVAAQALTKTAWYPLVKKVASILGYKITKKSIESVITKSVPVVGGAISGGLTYASFRPMGGKLADVFVKILNGDFSMEMELNPEYAQRVHVSDSELDNSIIDAEYVDISERVEDE